MTPAISVVVPTWNSEEFIGRSVQSILDQSLDGSLIELVVVDDCSTDRTFAMLQKLAARFPRIVVERLAKHSRGPGEARNRGVDIATGEWIAFLDADDEYADNGLETLLDLAEAAPCEIATARLVYVGADGSRMPGDRSRRLLPERLLGITAADQPELFYEPLSVFRRLYRRGSLVENAIRSPEGVVAQDTVFVTEALLRATRINYDPAVVYRYYTGILRSDPSISDKVDADYIADWVTTREMTVRVHERFGPSYLDIRYNLDLTSGLQRIARYYSAAAQAADVTARLDVLRTMRRFLIHHEHADLKNRSRMERALVLLIAEGLLEEADDLLVSWRQRSD